MEFKDVVYGRRSVRKFKDTPVDDKILKEITTDPEIENNSSEPEPLILDPDYSITSAADEIRKYKSLLDDGIITQEEFEAKKKQLLNL